MVRTLWLLGALVLVACGPSEEDRAKMKEKVAFESERAELIRAHLEDCDALGAELAKWEEEKKEARESIAAWWGGLSDGAKDKLIAENKDAWDRQSLSTMQGILKCSLKLKAGEDGSER
jgi:hypothetical protein